MIEGRGEGVYLLLLTVQVSLNGCSSVTVPGASITVTFSAGRGGTWGEGCTHTPHSQRGGEQTTLAAADVTHCGLQLASLYPPSLPEP